jgi:HSP20 family molecular chaperone IbpA
MTQDTLPVPTDQNQVAPQQSQKQHEGTRAQEQYISPPVDIYEDKDGLTVVADLPGVSKDNLDIQVKNDILTIQARTQHGIPGNPIYREFGLVNFFRQFRLADTVDTSKIQAELKHGVLTLRLPKAEEAKPRKIDVQIG